MFSCVWLHFKKIFGKYFLMFGKEEGKDKPKKNIINDRDLVTARSCEGEIAIDGAILRSVDRDLGSSSLAVDRDFFLGCGLCFSGFVLSFFFSKHQKIFSGKFFEMQPNTWKYFPFPEISISGKYVFFGKRFIATKHSLILDYKPILRTFLDVGNSIRANDYRLAHIDVSRPDFLAPHDLPPVDHPVLQGIPLAA